MATKLKRVLVAEDEKPYSRALVLKLQKAGFEAESAGDGEAALALLEERKFDALILDLIMPKKNGFAVLEELKAKKVKIPTIVLSNLSQEEDKSKVKSFGVKDFIEKSNTPIADVIKKVEGVFS